MLDERQHTDAKAMVSSYGPVVPPPIQNNAKAVPPRESPVADMRDTILVKDVKLASSAQDIFESFGPVKHFQMDDSREAAIAVVCHSFWIENVS